ncbi:hypothetical protein [Proteiniphilum sp.]|uniref:hypothetical protein n=1 Tax=Proteiniphilum sp. TaxID=1926877 RepID=UPI00332A720E
MKKNYPIILIISCMIGLWTTGCQSGKSVPSPSPLLPVPSENQLEWHEMEMNEYIHFNTNTFTGKESGYGDESPSVFNPSELDTGQWISVLKETGFKGVILTCKQKIIRPKSRRWEERMTFISNRFGLSNFCRTINNCPNM